MFRDSAKLAEYVNWLIMHGQCDGRDLFEQLAILTVDFANVHHFDKNDRFHADYQKRWNANIAKIEQVLERKNVSDFEREYLTYVLRAQKEMDSHPTTCAYANVKAREGENATYVSDSEHEVFTYFVLPASKIAIRLRNRNMLTFFGNKFEHCTALSLVLDKEDGSVSALGCGMDSSGVRVVAWGSNSNPRVAETELRQGILDQARTIAAAQNERHQRRRERDERAARRQ